MEGTIGEIRLFGGNFAPRGWALCNGSLLQISSNQALFSILGTTYGGDGRSTFALPDLRGRVPLHVGQGPGLSNRTLGGKGGEEQVTLTEQQVAPHRHTVNASPARGTENLPKGNVPAGSDNTYATGGRDKMHADMIDLNSGGQPHNNMPPFIGLNYIICMIGIYPSRS